MPLNRARLEIASAFSWRRLCIVLLGLALSIGGLAPAGAEADDPLPSWNDGATKQSIIDFVTKVTKEGGPDFAASQDRIATIDNDGTLWVEQPIYTH